MSAVSACQQPKYIGGAPCNRIRCHCVCLQTRHASLASTQCVPRCRVVWPPLLLCRWRRLPSSAVLARPNCITPIYIYIYSRALLREQHTYIYIYMYISAVRLAPASAVIGHVALDKSAAVAVRRACLAGDAVELPLMVFSIKRGRSTISKFQHGPAHRRASSCVKFGAPRHGPSIENSRGENFGMGPASLGRLQHA